MSSTLPAPTPERLAELRESVDHYEARRLRVQAELDQTHGHLADARAHLARAEARAEGRIVVGRP